MIMIILDTNVISEAVLRNPDTHVADWYRNQTTENLSTTAITVAELFAGIRRMPAGRKRNDLSRLIDFQLLMLGDRILSFDAASAIGYAEIRAKREHMGRPISIQDAMIAAIARSHGAAVATRNIKDFEGTGVELINPWEYTK
ncbi:type II toxin-antitoxin system VapC family toxin [Bifidobacterium callitrichidarum]|nr:type II toxin-antitoxin system VapC family toxin [Bifidobacterium callitrichidarum]